MNLGWLLEVLWDSFKSEDMKQRSHECTRQRTEKREHAYNFEGISEKKVQRSERGKRVKNNKYRMRETGGQKVQTSRGKINKSWGYNVQHGDYS